MADLPFRKPMVFATLYLGGNHQQHVNVVAHGVRASEKINYPKSGADYGPRMF